MHSLHLFQCTLISSTFPSPQFFSHAPTPQGNITVAKKPTSTTVELHSSPSTDLPYLSIVFIGQCSDLQMITWCHYQNV